MFVLKEKKRGSGPASERVGEHCCGCGACAAVCPVSCLAIEPDELGFVRPAYSAGCIGCGLCAKACPVLSVGDGDGNVSVIWAKAKDDGLRERSSSGAVFGLLAESALDVGGAVYGVAFSDGCMAVRHVRVVNRGGLDAVMRSKYVQSSVGSEVYQGVESDLRGGRRVLFSGTACQCAGMRNYLAARRVPTDGLLLVEVICHGVPSPRLWAEWLGHVSRGAGAEVGGVNFRSKSTGWSTYSVAYYVATEKVRSAVNANDWYMRAFLQNASLRQSCLACPAKRHCGADVTLGDFWGIRDFHSEAAADDKGVSAVICNTDKGEAAIAAVAPSLESGPSSMDEVVPGNPAFVRSAEPYPRRDAFLRDVAGGGRSMSSCADGRSSRPSHRGCAASSRRLGTRLDVWWGRAGNRCCQRDGPSRGMHVKVLTAFQRRRLA